MNILEQIVSNKRLEIKERKAQIRMTELEKSEFFSKPVFSMSKGLMDESKTGIIAEFKRQSPSKGMINKDADAFETTRIYMEYGASAVSVLTDEKYFGGSFTDLASARRNKVPILQKDFILDEFQVMEARSYGADAILLIATCLTPGEVEKLSAFAKNLGMEVLLEIHHEDQLKHVCADTGMIGVNNRNLETFTVDINRSIELSGKIPPGKIKISESGISNVMIIKQLRSYGYHGFLMGEQFMKQVDPAQAFSRFVHQLNEAV